MNDLNKQIAFISEVDQLKSILRQTSLLSNERRENSAEHSWHAALTAQVLFPYFEIEISTEKVIKMLLIHDIVEIDAGDTFAFNSKYYSEEQAQNEKKAAHRIFGLLPEDQGDHFESLWLEFEAGKTNEAKCAKAIDRILPAIQNIENYGGTWKKYNISRDKILARNHLLKEIAPKLWIYLNEKLQIAIQNKWIKD